MIAAVVALAGCTVTRDTALQDKWTTYGNTSSGPSDFHWTGGDDAASVQLPDGRDIWLFSDPFVRPVANGKRPCGSGDFVGNAFVEQQTNGTLGPTRLRTVGGQPQALIPPGDSTHRYTLGSGTVENNELRVAVYAIPNGGINLEGVGIARFSLPSLNLIEVRGIVAPRGIYWGSGYVDESDHTYIYGWKHEVYATYTYVARTTTPKDLLSPWEYWTGTGWSSSQADAQPVRDDAAQSLKLEAGTAINLNGTYYLIGIDGDGWRIETARNHPIKAYTSSTPYGPWSNPTTVYAPPETEPVTPPGGGPPAVQNFAYNVQIHPESANAGDGLLLSYNVDAYDRCAAGPNFDVERYRPRFIRVKP